MRKFFLLPLLCLILAEAYSQKSKLDPSMVQNFMIEDGLSHYGLTALLEDHNGMIWVGSYDGLGHYNGFEFKNYRNNLYEKKIASNQIRSLFQDKHHNIWVGTNHGLSIYRYDTQKFEHIYDKNSENRNQDDPCIIKDILKINNHIACVTEYEGILFFNEDSYELEYRHPISVRDKSIQFIYDAEVCGDHILLATGQGLIDVNVKEKRHEYLFKKLMKRSSCITKDAKGNIYIAGFTRLHIIREDTGKKDSAFKLIKTVFSNGRFMSLNVDTDGKLWLGLKPRGLAVIDKPLELKRRERFERSKCDQYYDINRVSAILPMTKSGSWVGSYSRGLYHLKKQALPFQYADLNSPNQKNDAKTVRNYKVLQASAWDSTNVMLSVYLWGIVNFNTKTSQVDPLPKELQSMPFPAESSAIVIDEKGGKWMRYALSRGKQYYQAPQETKKWVKIQNEDVPDLSMAKLANIVIDKFGYHWLASNIGLYRLKMNNDGTIQTAEALYQHPKFIESGFNKMKQVYVDPEGEYVWVGTVMDGLLRIKNTENTLLKNMEVEQYLHNVDDKSSISHSHISSILRLPNKELWIGTEGGGLNLVKNGNTKPVFECYSEINGLDNNVVKSIVADQENHLWVTTNKGLNYFNTKEKSFVQFSSRDGVRSIAFENAGLKLANGKVVFGAGNGLSYFAPNIKQDEVPLPKLMLNRLRVFNEEVEVGDTLNNHVILTKSLDESKSIELNHDENVFSIDLVSLHFSDPQNYEIKYRLLPDEKKWIIVSSNQKVVSFNGLPPGKYTFEASASNSKEKWSEPIQLSITIHPPFWKTPWAYFAYTALVMTILFIVFRFLVRLKMLKHNLQIEHLERERVDELNRTKERLFMNISHEFRTPLTLITGPIQMLMNMFESNNDAFVHLDLIQRQSRKMFQLVNQVQDFHKAEQSVLKMKKKSFDFTELMMNLKQDFQHLAEKSGKELVLEGDANQLFVLADESKLEIVLNNLLNNAFKFTEKGDSVAIRYGIQNEELFFEISDTGMGVDEEDLPHLFERYYQSEKDNTSTIGSGIGLAFSKRLVEMHYGSISVESQKGKGTTFTVQLPVQVNKEEALNEQRMNDILAKENDEERQRLMPNSLELPSNLVDESLKELNVFYVEDNQDLREFVKGVLSEYFNVTSFVNGKKCLDQIENEWPDLIISDILMPELNGLELCQAIKSDIRTSHIPVVLLTSRSAIDDQVKGLEMGADSYISKPFDMKHLIATAQMLLKNRKQLRERFQIDFPVEVKKNNSSKDDNIFLEKLYELFEENLSNEDVDMNKLAKGLYLNRTTFFQKVKAVTNHTPYELLKVYRLKKAAELLVQEKASVADAYIQTGFKNRTHFSRMFKDYYGVPPSKYGKAMEVADA